MSQKHPIVALVSAVSNRQYSRHSLSKSLELISVDSVEVEKQKSPPLLVTEKHRPLVVMLAWMLAKKQHLNKYAEVYLKRGYDVLTVHITPWQLMWPVNGTQMSQKHPIVALVSAVSNRQYSRHSLSKSLELISVDSVEVEKQKSPPLLVTEKHRPLVVMLAWMLAKKQHLNKYAEVYLKRGYDVLTVHITPWQLMWPVNGTQMSQKHPIVALVSAVSNRQYSRHSLSKSLELISVDSVEVEKQKSPPLLVTEKHRPLVVMLAWMLAKKQHLNKYAEVYLKRGYDVLTVHITPWQLMWPVNGTQIVADEVLQFLHHNSVCQPLLLHGFSVGGYVWGEVMVKMKQDLEQYQHVIDRIIGQAWDSAVDVTEINIGLPLAVFPKNPILRSGLEKYVRYHLKTFHEAATIHYLRSSQLFHTNLVHSPALLLVSKSDPIASVSSNLRVRDTWRSMGIKTYWKCWDDSKHVSHILKYRTDYIQTLEAFLDSLKDGQEDSLLQEKIQAKL